MNITSEQIQEAKKKLGSRGAEIIATDLGITGWENEKMVKSIFKNEKTNSMHWHSESNMFKCFATQKKYDILDHYVNHDNLTFPNAVQKLFKEANMEIKESDVAFKPSEKKAKSLIAHTYPSDEPSNDRLIVERYMEKRGISPFTLDFCNVKQDANGNVAFQFFDTNNQHISTKYRVSKGAKNGEQKWWWKSQAPLLYGENRINPTKPMLIVEGLCDRLVCVEAGYSNVVSIPGGALDFNWVDFSYEFLEEVVEFIIFSDDDEAGRKMSSELPKKLGEVKCKVVKPSQEVKDSVAKYYKTNFNLDIDKIDANNVLLACGANELIRMIEDAEPIPNDKLGFLMQVEDIEIEDMEKLSTGFRALDEIMYGNLMGCFTIITGEPNSGKSVFANQLCVLSALEQGYKPMIFSGELGSPQLLNWVLKPLAGLNHAYRWSKDGSPVGFSVTKQAKAAIKKYYNDKIIYFSDKDTLSASGEDIIDEMTYAYKRYGTKVMLLDNLMTVNTASDDNEDKNVSETKFIKRLLEFTNRYNACVFLVAHPKKPTKGEQLGIYSVAGASQIVNLCHRLLSVTRLENDPEGFNTEIRIIKDRPTGMANKKCKLCYDNKDMRLYSNQAEKIFQYRWERETTIVYDEATKRKLACNVKEGNEDVFGSIAD